MEIELIPDADFELVQIINGTPHCKQHGAMNKITADGFWRCITVSGYQRVKDGNATGQKHIETICRAGCLEIKNATSELDNRT